MLTDGHLEDLRNHYADGYGNGIDDERSRILSLINDLIKHGLSSQDYSKMYTDIAELVKGTPRDAEQ
jgi:hypothetical protein